MRKRNTRILKQHIGLWTFWLETGKESKELLDEQYRYFHFHAKKVAQEIANETNKVVYIRKTKRFSPTALEDVIYPNKKGD